MTDTPKCPKCGGDLNKDGSRCFTCGYASKIPGQYKLGSTSQRSPLGNIIMIIAALGGLAGMALTWALYGMDAHTGYSIILGSFERAPLSLELHVFSTYDATQLTKLFLSCFLLFNLFILVLTMIPWKRFRIAASVLFLLLFIVMDIFLVLIMNNIPPLTVMGALVLDGKGYHISVFSLFFGSMGALVNLILPNLPRY